MTTALPLHRRDDHETSQQAAEKLLPHLSDLQSRVLAAFREEFPAGATDGQVEALPRFSDCGYSTIRKRCSELRRMGMIEPTGKKVNGMKVHRALSRDEYIRRKYGERFLF